MTLRDIVELVQGTVLTRFSNGEQEVRYVASSDLMSDVLVFAKPHAVLITGLTNVHVVHTAEMADLCAVIFARGKTPTREVIALAEDRGKPLISSQLTLFEICGRLFHAGMQACDSEG